MVDDLVGFESDKVAGDLYEAEVNDEADSEDIVEDDTSELSVVVELESSSIATLLRSLGLLLVLLVMIGVETGGWFELDARGGISSLGGVIDRRLFWDRLSVSGEDLLAVSSVDLELKPLPSFEVKSFQVLLNALPLGTFELSCLVEGFFFAL